MRVYVGWLWVALACASCGGSDGGGGGGGGAADDGSTGDGGDADGAGDGGDDDPLPEGAWTVFVYGHGDHNLSQSLVTDIVEMANAEIASEVRVVVLADFDASQNFDAETKFPSGVQWLLVEGGGKEPAVIAEEPELNLDDPAVLRAAIANVFTNVPGKRRAVILWDHGGSWQGGFGSDTQNGTVAPTPMHAAEAAEAIGQGLAQAGIDDEVPLDLFSFDTCLMAGAEVAWEFRDLAKVYIANAEIDYGNGWDYTNFLSYLSAHQDESAEALAAREVELWNAHHEGAGADDALLRSHVAISTEKLIAFGTAYHAFVEALTGSSALSGVELGRSGYFSLPPYMNEIANPTASPELRDLGMFLTYMGNVSDDAVATKAKSAYAALDAAILARSQGDIREAAKQVGFHVSLPLAAAMTEQSLDAYADLAAGWNASSGWLNVLTMYGTMNDGVEPTITATIANDTNPTQAAPPTVTFSSADADVAQAEVNLAMLDPADADQLTIYGLVGRGAIDAGSSYDFAWDGQLVSLGNGQGVTQPLFVRVWEDVGLLGGDGASPVLASFGAVTVPGSEPVLGALLFQDSDAEVGVLALLDPPVTLTLAEIAKDFPGTTFQPVYIGVTLSTAQESVVGGTPVPLDAASLPLSTTPAGAGTYVLMTSVEDVFGNVGVDTQIATLTGPLQP